jgi:hypothetical protein
MAADYSKPPKDYFRNEPQPKATPIPRHKQNAPDASTGRPTLSQRQKL